jgi:hypothetical protein
MRSNLELHLNSIFKNLPQQPWNKDDNTYICVCEKIAQNIAQPIFANINMCITFTVEKINPKITASSIYLKNCPK